MPSLECRVTETGQTPLSDAELRPMAAAAWHRHGTVVLRLDWIKNRLWRETLEAIMAHVFGERRG